MTQLVVVMTALLPLPWDDEGVADPGATPQAPARVLVGKLHTLREHWAATRSKPALRVVALLTGGHLMDVEAFDAQSDTVVLLKGRLRGLRSLRGSMLALVPVERLVLMFET